MAIERRTALLAKKETTYGTDAHPAPNSDAIEIFDFSLSPNIEQVERKPYKESISPEATIAGKKYAQLSFYVEIKGNGAQNDGKTEPRFTRLLEACGFDVSAIAESAAGAGDGYFELKPKSDDFASLTFYAYLDDTLFVITGARGTCSFDMTANQVGKISFEFTGKFNKPSEVATFPDVTYETAPTPALCKGAGLTMGGSFADGSGNTPPAITGGYAPILSKFTVELANDMAQRDDLNDPTGVGDFSILSRNTKGTVDPDTMKLSDYDIWQKFEAGEPQAIGGSVGNDAGNIVEVFVPKAVYNNIGLGVRDGIRTYETAFTAVGDDDEVVVVLR